MKFRYIEESLTKLKDYRIYYTFNWDNILNYVKSREKPWSEDTLFSSNTIRLIYDKNLDLFIMGDGEDYIHMNLFDGLIHTTNIYDKLNILNDWESYFHKNIVSVVISDDLLSIKRDFDYSYLYTISEDKIYFASDSKLYLSNLEVIDGNN